MNKVLKFIAKCGNYYLILQTEGESDFWVWLIQQAEFNHWSKADIAVPTIESLELFANDVNNDTTGTSWASFDTIEEAERSI